jgi:hypothetical protein
MPAKLNAKNPLTLPKAITQASGRVRIQRADAVRARLAELELTEADVADAVRWARSSGARPKK